MAEHISETPSSAHLRAVCLFATHTQLRVIFLPLYVNLNLRVESVQSEDEVDGVVGVEVEDITGDAVGDEVDATGDVVGEAVGEGVPVPSSTQSDGNEYVVESETAESSIDPA